MMKKISVIIITVFIIINLCGCTSNRELDEQSFVCTICFSGNSEYKVMLEVITENSDEKKLSTKVVSATGKTPENAVDNIKNQLSKGLMFDHCAAIVISPQMSEKRQKAALQYCVKSPTLNLGTPVVYCLNQKELLSSKPESTGIGFDIMLTLKQLSLEKESRLYKTALTLENIQTFKYKDGMLIRVDKQ